MTKKERKIIGETIDKIIADNECYDDYWGIIKAFTSFRLELLKKGIEIDVINYKIK